jgi:hypothetical protein
MFDKSGKPQKEWYCLVCRTTHKICYHCYKHSNIIDKTIMLQCCLECHIIPEDKIIPSTWKNKWLMDNPINIKYPSWIKNVIEILLLIIVRTDLLPNELWHKIFKNLNLNYIGRQYPNHSFIGYTPTSPLRSYCYKCKQWHYMEDGNILTILDNYPIEIAKKIMFVILFTNYYRVEHKMETISGNQFWTTTSGINSPTNQTKRITYKSYCDRDGWATDMVHPCIRSVIENNNFFYTNENDYKLTVNKYKQDILHFVNSL